jgi:hypothetical protein
MVEETILLLQALTLIGGNSSSLMVSTLLTSRIRRHLMLKEEKTQKVKPFGFGEDIMVRIRDGRSFTLQIEKLIERRD